MVVHKKMLAARLVAIRDDPNTDPAVAARVAQVIRDKPELQDLVKLDADLDATLTADPATITSDQIEQALQVSLRNFDDLPDDATQAASLGAFGKRARRLAPAAPPRVAP